MHNFKNLKIWQKGIENTINTYNLTKNFPQEEKFGLVSQMRRAAVSIPSNIAEGSARNGLKDFSRFLALATGSSYELETQVIIAQRLNYVSEEEFSSSINGITEIQKMLSAFSKTIKI